MSIKLIRDNTRPIVEKGEQRELIDKAAIERLAKRPRTGADEVVQDSETPGFRLRRTAAGTVLFIFQGRVRGGEGINKGKVVKRTIGPAKGRGAIAVSKARMEATALREALAKGIDPADELRAAADAAEAAKLKREREQDLKKWTTAYALEHMLEWRASRPNVELHLKPATVTYYRRGIGYFGKLVSVPITELKPQAIRTALDKLDGTAKAAKARRALSGVIEHALKHLELDIRNPVTRLDRGEFKAPPPRESYIKEAEVGEWIANVLAIQMRGGPHIAQRVRDYVLLTLLYGTRKNELMQMEWSWLDWDADSFTLPKTITKQKRTHTLPLTEWTRAIFQRRYEARKEESPFVFPGRFSGEPMRDVRLALQEAVGEDFKLHDARRTLATHCSSLGISGTRLKAILGHSRIGVTENYDRQEIAQVRRDLESYHGWLRDKHYWFGFEQAFPDAQWEAAQAASAAPKQAQSWPGG